MRGAILWGTAIIAAGAWAAPLAAQAAPAQADPLNEAVRLGHRFMERQLSVATSRMSEEDYAFRPTPEVRTFGQIIAHIADNNYAFCSKANGESSPPVEGVETTRTTKSEIDRALAESFAYCAGVYAAMTDEKARTTVQFGSSGRPAMAVLMFKSLHNSLHYGNVITYMRLRGKVPPPSAL